MRFEKKILTYRKSLYSDSFFIALVVVLANITSALVVFVAGRNLAEQSLANFLVSWSIMNTISLVFMASLESHTPQLMAEVSRAQISLKLALRNASMIQLIATSAAIGTFLLINMSSRYHLALNELVMAGALLLSTGVSTLNRAVDFGNRKYRNCATRALLNLALVFAGTGIFYLVSTVNLVSLYAILAFSNFASSAMRPSCEFIMLSKEKFKPRPSCDNNQFLNSVKLVGTFSFSTIVDLAISNSGVIILGFIESNASRISGYVGSISVYSVPFLVINSRLYSVLHPVADEVAGSTSFIWKSRSADLAKLLAQIAVSGIILLPIAGRIVDLVFPTAHKLTTSESVMVWLALASSSVQQFFRLVVIAENKGRLIILTWTIGVCTYFGMLSLPLSPVIRISFSSILASVVIITLIVRSLTTNKEEK